MKIKGLSIKELAAYIGISTDTVRRAARRGEIPFKREGTAYRFDWRKVRQAMNERGNQMRFGGKGQRDRRHEATARAIQSPPVGNTGALATGIVTGGLSVR